MTPTNILIGQGLSTIDVKAARVATAEKGNDKDSDFRLLAGNSEIGVTSWQEADGKPLLRVELDDPSSSLPSVRRLARIERERRPVWSWNRKGRVGAANKPLTCPA